MIVFQKAGLGHAWLSEDKPAFSAAYDCLISLISFDCFSKGLDSRRDDGNTGERRRQINRGDKVLRQSHKGAFRWREFPPLPHWRRAETR
jgi:hypothetical protein